MEIILQYIHDTYTIKRNFNAFAKALHTYFCYLISNGLWWSQWERYLWFHWERYKH